MTLLHSALASSSARRQAQPMLFLPHFRSSRPFRRQLQCADVAGGWNSPTRISCPTENYGSPPGPPRPIWGAVELNKREKDFLAAAFIASWRQARVFEWDIVCGWLKCTHDECAKTSRRLEKAGLLNRLSDQSAILTTAGLEAGKGIRDEPPPAIGPAVGNNNCFRSR